MKLQLLIWAMLGCLLPAVAGAVSIRNIALEVRFDETAGQITVHSPPGAAPFAADGKLDGVVTRVTAGETNHPVFGAGQAIRLELADGSLTTLSLHADLPFLLVRKTQRNGADQAANFATVEPVTFQLRFEQPAAALRTMGTGGLLAPADNPGSYLFLACADPATRAGVVAGWVTQNKGSGSVFSPVDGDGVGLKARLEHGHLILPPGETVELDTFAIGWFADARLGLERFADAVAAAHAIKLRPKTAVYCSWYAEGPGHGGAGSDASTRGLARFVAESGLRDHGLGVIQIDDRWQDGPQIQGPASCFDRVNPKGPYPDGIAPVAAEVERHGLVFGLWWLPFGRNHMQPEFADRQDWFFKWPDGKPLRQKGFGGTCLDSSHPAVQQHLADLGRTIRSWGVKYYKMDGLNVGCGVDHCYINDGYKEDGFGKSRPPHNPALTQIEVMRKGLKTIREASGDEVFFSGCCANQNMRTYAGSIGLVDSMRVGPDFNHDGEGIRSGPLRGSWVYFLNGRVWWNDPDPTKVRTSNEPCDADNSARGAVTLEQA
nr:alpha-galactosidase [Akkermansiaceae bacterium]